MKKIILVATMLAFSTSAFAANAPTATKAPKAKVVHSACDPVKNASACKSTVHHKAPKKKKKKLMQSV